VDEFWRPGGSGKAARRREYPKGFKVLEEADDVRDLYPAPQKKVDSQAQSAWEWR